MNDRETTIHSALDIDRVREDFPILSRQVHGKPLIYLDTAATAQRPNCVIEATADFYRSYNANIHRGVHLLSQEATESYEAARGKLAGFLNASEPGEIVFTRGTTEAINLVAQSFLRPRIGPGDEILITHMEHHANIVPWQMLSEQTGATLKVVPINDRGELELEALEDMLSERVKLLGVVHVSNALGTINPVSHICRLAGQFDIPVLVDGAQAMPHQAVDVQALGCTFYCLSGHKVYGPTGVGALWSKADTLADMPPYQGGGEMIDVVTFEGTTYNDPPGRFEAGTPNIAGAIGLAAAIEYLEGLGMERVARSERELLDYATGVLSEIEGLNIVGTAARKAGVISFTLDEIHPNDIGTLLDHHGIAIRTGHHCAMPAIKFFGLPATARASFGIYSTPSEVDRLATALRQVQGMFQ